MVDMNRLRNVFSEEQPPERVDRMWRAIEAMEHRDRRRDAIRNRPARTLLRPILVFAGGAAAALIVALLVQTPSDDGPLQTEIGATMPKRFVAETAAERQFSDGSTLRLSGNSALEVEKNTNKTVRMALKHGRAQFDIVPGGPRKWQVVCGDITVTVLGTRFTVTRDHDQVMVDVERGTVMVTGKWVDGGAQTLIAGESLLIENPSLPPLPPEIGEDEDDAVTPHEDAPEPAIAAPEIPEETSQRRRPKAEWKVHAEAGDFEEAFAELGSAGVAALTQKSKDIDDLFKLADVARLSGHPLDAVAPLQAIVTNHPDNPRAGLAAYTLGKLYLEKLSSPKKAVEAFNDAIRLGIPEALMESAYVKKAKALFLLSAVLGKWAAEEYLKKYPNGRYQDQVKTWLKSNPPEEQ